MFLFEVDEKNEEKQKIAEKQQKISNVKKDNTNKEKKTKKEIYVKDDENIVVKELKEIKSFSYIEGNIIEQFKNNKLHHAIMLSGKYGIGKATFAYWLISRLIFACCEQKENPSNLKEMHFDMLKRNVHPDVFFLEVQEGENEIKVEQIRVLLEKIYLKSNYGYKFVIIDDINSINLNGVNALLKTLEEPPSNTYFFVINHQNSNVLDTIYSRCNEIKLKLSKSDCIKILQDQNVNLTFDEIEFYADLSNNSVKLSNIMIDLNLKNEFEKLFDDFEKNKQFVFNFLNILYSNIELKYKKLSRAMKMSILENIIVYIIKKSVNLSSNCDLKNLVLFNNKLLKQFYDIKNFELPVKFFSI